MALPDIRGGVNSRGGDVRVAGAFAVLTERGRHHEYAINRPGYLRRHRLTLRGLPPRRASNRRQTAQDDGRLAVQQTLIGHIK